MTGTVNKIPHSKKDGKYRDFCFIKSDDGKDVFLHINDFNSSWIELEKRIEAKEIVKIEFEEEKNEKGWKASSARFVE